MLTTVLCCPQSNQNFDGCPKLYPKAHLLDDEVVLSELDKEVLPDAVSRREDPARSNQGSAAKNLAVLVQDGHLPRPTALGGFSSA